VDRFFEDCRNLKNTNSEKPLAKIIDLNQYRAMKLIERSK
jgi:hypothetical protein